MTRYLVKRFLLMIPTLLGVAVLVFVLLRVLPGDVVEMRFVTRRQNQFLDQKMLDAERAKLGLDKPIWRQFVAYLTGLLRLDLGLSMWTGSPDHRGDQAPVRALAPARADGHAGRDGAGDPARDRGRAAPGHVDRLRRPRVLDRRPGDALVLAGHPADPGPSGRVQVAAADGLHAVLGRPLAEPRPARLAGAGRRVPLLGGRHADDPVGDARGAARGLHPHGAGQGALDEADPHPPRAEERDAPGAHRDRPRVRVPARRAGRHRAGVQPERPRPPLRRRRSRTATTR